MFQKCPCCGGTGKEYNMLSNTTFNVCSVYKGTKIISELTGLPPSYTTNIADEIAKVREDINEFKKYQITLYEYPKIEDNEK